ncbi:TPA: hypothetical protein R6W42_001708 [Citrobacter freundii]|uniref:hypothetical protein n=1 Tax=Enterobacteriaceae TaxID=543 RepID=UPI000D3BA676|nr:MULTISPECIES: hypothetical protein [Enterobacteriaceae]MBJ9311334.1 hypothetical protein [Citrobacter freundii]RAU49096.1 hypothetical protein DBY68_011015 [Pseudocitrobacter sp. RIT 415]HEE0086714.1 hypothetical protein [Citrobacter freundii]HEI8940833.1 hypothetical protein [Citrobacter freundii]HEJ0167494.1 hypothetical protein [Citrobacter freundii]
MGIIESVLLFAFGKSESIEGEFAILIFSLAASLYGLLIVLLDFLTSKTTKKASFLKLSYSGFGAILVILMWGAGAGIGALIGAGIGIFEIKKISCIFVGAIWPTVIPRLLSSSNNELSKEKIDIPEDN